MVDIKVGMRLACKDAGAISPITVTELTERGFKYKLDAPICVHPRLGITYAAEGHEHFGIDGESFYELEDKTMMPKQLQNKLMEWCITLVIIGGFVILSLDTASLISLAVHQVYGGCT